MSLLAGSTLVLLLAGAEIPSATVQAIKRLNMDEGFPFTSKWGMPRLMTEIRKAVAENDMPPTSYLKKKGASLSASERQAIVGWASDAEALLEGQSSP